jgi:hypothetical protein
MGFTVSNYNFLLAGILVIASLPQIMLPADHNSTDVNDVGSIG